MSRKKKPGDPTRRIYFSQQKSIAVTHSFSQRSLAKPQKGHRNKNLTVFKITTYLKVIQKYFKVVLDYTNVYTTELIVNTSQTQKQMCTAEQHYLVPY